MDKTKRPTGAFIGMIAFSAVLYVVMTYLQKNMLVSNYIPTYLEMEQGAAQGKIMYWIMWIFGDMTEANFFKSYIAGIGLIAGSIVAHYLNKRNSKYQGISIAYGSGLWPWVLCASTVSLILSNLIYGWNLANGGWFPTFVVFVSVPAATILVYGGNLKNLLTGAIAAVIVCVPLSRMFMVHICGNIGIPGVAGSVFGMWAGAIICFEIYKLLPWMHLPEVTPPVENEPKKEYKHIHPSAFYVKRILADFSEPVFAGNEIASICMLIGLFISWVLCPELPVYGSGILPTLLMAEFITGAISMYVYWDHWMERAWFPSFPSMVSVAPGIALFYGGSIPIAILAAIFGGIICPAMTDFVLQRLPKHWPAVIGTTFSMTVGTVVVGMFVICTKGIIPGL